MLRKLSGLVQNLTPLRLGKTPSSWQDDATSFSWLSAELQAVKTTSEPLHGAYGCSLPPLLAPIGLVARVDDD